ncbi:MAG: phenylalanine--tRNA ligase subunit beta [Flavobacteriales bacterium]
MNISYNWLKNYLNIHLPVEEVAKILTDIGLEVGGFETIQSVKGGLEGLVIGEVKEKEKHPDAYKLSLTKVDVGSGELLNIVCGAPNVAAGQKVVVATIGTVLYNGDESFTIKKSKIRGALSEGMLCGADEVGLGKSDGIMVLDASVAPGTLAKEYFKVSSDTVLEVDATPNRADALSHFGIARDLYAYLKTRGEAVELKKPAIDAFKVEETSLPISVVVEDVACPRYAGVCISGVEVKESPDWLKNQLLLIGLKPINNVVDVTNYVLHELGQPLHAFDYDLVKGQVIVKKNCGGKKFVTLDKNEHELSDDDLMICNATEPMCVAGVMGGLASGTTLTTKNVFLEAAYFNPVSVRKTSKRISTKSDSSYRFERGTDPNMVITALKRAALLIKEVAGGKIASEVVDVYPQPVQHFAVDLRYQRCNDLLGEELPKEKVKQILSALEIEIASEDATTLKLKVPPYRVDVQREVDVIEDILRIYGYNTIAIPRKISAAMEYTVGVPVEKIRSSVSQQLSALGFNEILCNSLTNKEYYQDYVQFEEAGFVELLNPLSKELMVLRRSMIFGAMEAVQRNQSRQRSDLQFYEFGKTYRRTETGYHEQYNLTLLLTGNKESESWNAAKDKVNFFSMKGYVEQLCERIGLKNVKLKASENAFYAEVFELRSGKKVLGEIGVLNRKLSKNFDVKDEVFVANILWDTFCELAQNNKIQYSELPKFPEVRRDLSLLLNKETRFAELETLAFDLEKQLIKEVSLFDVYEGKNLAEGKKSYALSFILQDAEKTLVDKQIDKVMEKLINGFKEKLGAEIR